MSSLPGIIPENNSLFANSFVVDSINQDAYATAMRFTEDGYGNPLLVICGDAGNGKTLLMGELHRRFSWRYPTASSISMGADDLVFSGTIGRPLLRDADLICIHGFAFALGQSWTEEFQELLLYRGFYGKRTVVDFCQTHEGCQSESKLGKLLGAATHLRLELPGPETRLWIAQQYVESIPGLPGLGEGRIREIAFRPTDSVRAMISTLMLEAATLDLDGRR